MDGSLRKGQQIKFMAAGTTHLVDRVGCFTPKRTDLPELGPGEIGFITAQIKEVAETRVGDTITDAKRPTAQALPGFKVVQPVVFCGLFPTDAADFEKLRDSLYKLRLNDASFSFEMETSAALGFGFRCGFLGLLHLEIIQERLTREYDLDLITTAPSVVYEVHLRGGKPKAVRPELVEGPSSTSSAKGKNDPSTGSGQSVVEIHNPADWPDASLIEAVEEPWIEATIYTPDEYLGSILKLCQDRRGIQKDLTYVGTGSHARAMLKYELPLNEVVFDFYDRLKSISRGYASFDYHQVGHREGDLVKMSILVNGEPVDALSMIVHRANAEARGRGMCERLKDLIPRHLFKIPIQAAIGGKVIARETIGALRKDVTAKCYGGDATRKRKLLEKQKEGKKRMREYGSVSIPQEAFIAALRMGDDT
jgi:GTP-binding protein LepA